MFIGMYFGDRTADGKLGFGRGGWDGECHYGQRRVTGLIDRVTDAGQTDDSEVIGMEGRGPSLWWR